MMIPTTSLLMDLKIKFFCGLYNFIGDGSENEVFLWSLEQPHRNTGSSVITTAADHGMLSVRNCEESNYVIT